MSNSAQRNIENVLTKINWNIEGCSFGIEDFKCIQNQPEVLECYCEVILLEILENVRNRIVPSFWQHFENPSPASSLNDYAQFERFVGAISMLEENHTKFAEVLSVIKPESSHKLDRMFQEALLAQTPANFAETVHGFSNVMFNVFANVYKVTPNLEESYDADLSCQRDLDCPGCQREMEDCQCQHIIDVINNANSSLLRMKLFDRIAGQAITTLVQRRIDKYIEDTCRGIFDRSHLPRITRWLENVTCWIIRIINHGKLETETGADESVANIVHSFKTKLTYFMYEKYSHLIIDQFFNIIIEFPDSIPAIDDLKSCMEKIEFRKLLIKNLTQSFKSRILHPGVNTIDILTAYIAAIRTIRHLDNSGILLDTITAPIKEYLRNRADTVRRVVASLTDESPTDLSEELCKADKGKGSATGLSANSEWSSWEEWMPDSLGLEANNCALPAGGRASRPADIISMVVNIYGSKELFMNEYRNLLADRLLAYFDFNPENDIRNLELLKVRFGESLLHPCEVMLKDIADSKRINAHIESNAQYGDCESFDVSSLIISAQYWPPLNKENLELPEEITRELDKYKAAYEVYKGNRTLNWRNTIGRVQILIELTPDKVLEFTVSPTQAVIIYHFQNVDQWALDDLSALMKVPAIVLRRRMGYWITQGLIREVQPNIFKLVAEDSTQSQVFAGKSLMKNDDDIESAMASISDQREEELQVFWSYIVGMLTNLDSLPIERIHQMLKLFATRGTGVDLSQEDLKAFLQRKVREHRLVFTGGVYQLPK